MDLFIDHKIQNCRSLLRAFKAIQLGTAYLTSAQKIFDNEVTIFDDVIRIDVLTRVTGLEFDLAWKTKNELSIDDVIIPFVSIEHLIQSKQAAGRKQDLEDVDFLIKIKSQDLQ
jgi:hypothetical protein